MTRLRHAGRLASLLVLAVAATACQVPVRPSRPAEAAPVAAPPAATPAPVAAPVTAPAPKAEPVVDTTLDTGEEVFAKLEGLLSAPICVKGEHNRTWRKRYAGYPDNFARHLGEILPLLAYVVEQVEAKKLPGEFALIPIVESWYRPEAIGPGGPAGMWQMITSTARNHGIRVQSGYDGRLSPVESTESALSYLSTLHGMFGEWRATAMAYNAGEYRILRAFRASSDNRVSGERHLPRGLSRTTYDYIAKLHALACLIAEPGRHDLHLPLERSFIPLRAMDLPEGTTSLDAAARSLGTDASELRRLNPAYRQGRIIPGVPRRVLAPVTALVVANDAGVARAAQQAAGSAEDTASSGRRHVVARGDTLSAIAKRYGVGLPQLLRVNGLGSRSILRIGQELKVDP